MRHHFSSVRVIRGLLAAVGVSALVVGCKGPLDNNAAADASLRNAVVVEHRKHLLELADNDGTPVVIEVQRDTSDVEGRLSAERLDELNQISGAEAYRGVDIEPGTDLAGQKKLEIVRLSLDEAVALAVAGNLDLEVARLTPKVAAAQLEQAEADFDTVVFADLDWQKLDTPQPAGTVPGLANDFQQENFSLNTGIRRNLTSGGVVQLDTTIARNERVPSFFAVDSYYDADVLLSVTQPLLRGFGSQVSQAQILLARNAEASARQQLRQTMNDLVGRVEQGYWNLDLARRQVLIQQRLLDRTVAERVRLEELRRA